MFGCKKCDALVNAGKKLKGCTMFQSENGEPPAKMYDFARQVSEYGFITHTGEIATCTICWMAIKIGKQHTVSSVMGARAHAIPCQERHEKLVKSKQLDRPNRAEAG
jgi:hypothetical protein